MATNQKRNRDFLRPLRVSGVVFFFCMPAMLARAQTQDIDEDKAQPIAFRIASEESLEAFYDGDYAEALRLNEKAVDWTRDTENKKLMASRNFDVALVDVWLLAQRILILGKLGDEERAHTTAERALKILESRRIFYLRKKPPEFRPALWMMEADINFARGELDMPRADFMPDNDQPPLPPNVEKRGKDLGDPGTSKVLFKKAEKILDKFLGVVLPEGPDVWVGGGVWLNDLVINVLVNSARTSIQCHGTPGLDKATDALSYLTRAEEVQAQNVWFKRFIAPDAPFPVSYRVFEDAEAEKIRGQGNQNRLPRETLLIQMKQQWAGAIRNWLAIRSAQAEAFAYIYQLSDGERIEEHVWAGVAAERAYARATNLVRAQFRADHPSLHEVELSKARWSIIMADPRGAKKLPAFDVKRRISWCRDCIFLMAKSRATERFMLDPKDRDFYDYAELRALRILRTLHGISPCLSEAQLNAIQKREIALIEKLDRE